MWFNDPVKVQTSERRELEVLLNRSNVVVVLFILRLYLNKQVFFVSPGV